MTSRRLMLACILAVAACAASKSAGTASAVAGHTYVIDAIAVGGTNNAFARGSTPTIRFAATSVIVTTGCNEIGGSYSVSGDHITVTYVGASTHYSCGADLDNQERALDALVTGPVIVQIDGNRLTLTARDVRVSARQQ